LQNSVLPLGTQPFNILRPMFNIAQPRVGLFLIYLYI
jgi:hypothetical protein